VRIAVGTSGYAYKEWKGSFYPADLPADGMLRFYGSRFRAVEINNTFYRMPTEKVLVGWAADAPKLRPTLFKLPPNLALVTCGVGAYSSREGERAR
jgi:uncharacterized protein YecE (DUF72 family)